MTTVCTTVVSYSSFFIETISSTVGLTLTVFISSRAVSVTKVLTISYLLFVTVVLTPVFLLTETFWIYGCATYLMTFVSSISVILICWSPRFSFAVTIIDWPSGLFTNTAYLFTNFLSYLVTFSTVIFSVLSSGLVYSSLLTIFLISKVSNYVFGKLTTGLLMTS